MAVRLPPDDPAVPSRSRLRRRLRRWETLFGPSAWAARVVRRGLKLPFTSAPSPLKTRREVRDPEQRTALRAAVDKMLAAGAIRPASPTPRDVESLLFAVPKRGGGWRPCLNLKPLNRFIEAPPFSLRGIAELRQTLRPGDHMVSLDLRDAYWHIPLAPAHRRFFSFWFDGRMYRFDVLPFGVSVAPYVFHHMLRPLVSWLRQAGVRICAYLDDLLILGSSAEECRRHGQLVADLLADLGFRIHPDKSELIPATTRTFLGFVVDSTAMTLRLPAPKARRIARECRALANRVRHQNHTPSVRTVARLLGRITAASSAVSVHRFRSAHLERARAEALRAHGTYDAPCPLPPGALTDLRWWGRHLHHVHGRPVRLPPPDVLVRTDASALGWGAVVIDAPTLPSLRGRRLHGRLPPQLRQSVSNETELYGVGAALHALSRLAPLHHRHVRIQTDSTSALFYVNKGAGRSVALSDLVAPLWRLALRSGMLLSAEHLPGELNVEADALSRQAPSADDWTLRPRVFSALVRRFGLPSVDAFAEPANARLPRFCSRFPLPGALPLHGLLLDYSREFAYAFPPPRLVPLLLSRLLDQRATALLVLPARPQAPWWPLVLRYMPARVTLNDAVIPYLPRAPRFRQPRLVAGIFSPWSPRSQRRPPWSNRC